MSWASSESIRKTMLGNKRRDTKPELAVRRMLHARGLRYRVDLAPLKGYRRRADVVFTRQRIAIFIDGCFWHGCPLHYRVPGTNAGYWQPKIARNVERDAETTMALVAAGWTVLRYWEHMPAGEIVDDIVRAVSDRARETVRGVGEAVVVGPQFAASTELGDGEVDGVGGAQGVPRP